MVAVARRYHVSPTQVAEWNDIGATSMLKAGQQIVLHLPVRAAAARSPIRATAHPQIRSAAKPAAKGPVKPAPHKPAIQQKKRS